MRPRDPFFDVVKALAIFLVLVGHAHGVAISVPFPAWMINFRVGLNMPVFFMLSGYFAWRTVELHDWKKLYATIRGYFMPALVAGVVFLVCELAMGLTQPSLGLICVRMLRFLFVDPWFITTLTECYVALFVAMAIGRSFVWSVVMLVLLWLAVVCRPAGLPGMVSFGCFVSMLPSYLFGALVLRRLNCRLWENWKVGVSCSVVFMLFVMLEGNVGTNGMSFYTADSTVQAFQTLGGGGTFVLRPLVGIVGSIGVMWFVWAALKLVPQLKCLAKIGTLTLGIYIFHLWPLERLRGIAWIGSSRWSVLITSIAMLVFFSVVTWLLMEKTGRFRKWIWGK